MVESDPALEGMGTTLTAILWHGERFALAHIGDSRAYVLRDGQLYRVTRDHTLVQSLIDEGRIGEEEATMHPQRSLLLRALDGRSEVEPDVSVHDAVAGDRYLICSDGLSGVVSEDTLHETLNSGWDPDRSVQQLIELANRGGGPDNITCVVADVVEAGGDTEGAAGGTGETDETDETDEIAAAPLVVGAAAHAVPPEDSTEDTISMDTSAGRAAALMHPPDDDDEEERDESAGHRPRRKWPRIVVSLLVIVVVIGGAGYSAVHYVRSQYYVGSQHGEVVIFRGISPHVAGQSLSRVHTHTGLSLRQLPSMQRSAVNDNIQSDNLHGARQVVHRLRGAARVCAQQRRQEESRPTAGPRTDRSRTDRPREGEQDRRRQRHQDRGDRQQQGGQRQHGSQQRGGERSHSAPERAPAPSPGMSADPCPEGVSAADGY